MRSTRQLKNAKSANRLYRGAKISEYQFRRVLRAFAGDVPPTQLAQRMTLSLNGIAGIYQRLRAHYVEIGIFRDFYRDNYPNGAPNNEAINGFEAYEHALLSFHLARISRMRGVKPEPGTVDHHFCESCWRFGFVPFFKDRPAEPVNEMIFSELMTYVRVGGPVGTPAPNLWAIKAHQIAFADKKAAWLERNSNEFNAEGLRAALRSFRSL